LAALAIALSAAFAFPQEASAATGTISTVAGSDPFGDFSGDGGPATAAALNNPTGVAATADGGYLIADASNARVRRVFPDGTITTVAGTGNYAFSGDGGPATAADLREPGGVALDAQGRVYIADTVNARIRMVDTNGIITTVAGTGATNVLNHPHGVAIDSQGRVVIADTYNHRIRRLDAGTLTTIAGTGAFGYSGDGGPALSATLSTPYYVAVDSQDRILLSDLSNNRIRRIEVDNTITTMAGNGNASFSGDGGPATAAAINQPYKVATDAQDNVYIAEESSQRIRRVSAGGTISTLAGTDTPGNSGDAAAATSAQLAFPLGVAAGPGGVVVIADTNNNRVRRVDPTSGVITTVAGAIDPAGVGPSQSARFDDPQALVVGSSLTLVAAGTSGTLEALAGGKVSVVAGRYPQSAATGALARYRTGAFGNVGGVAIDDAAHLIYITETSANRLHVITEVDPSDPSTWTIAPLANTAGTAGFGDGAAATARFRAPTGLYLDVAAHTLYIADTGNHAIRALDLSGGTVSTTVNASHSLGYGGDGGPASGGLLFEPTALTRCSNGDMFIADTGNNRIRRVTSGTISTVLGDGVPASSGEGAPARTFPVDGPRGLACDAAGDLFVTSATTVRLLPASDTGIVDGSGPVQTIYGVPPRTMFPASVTACLTGIAVVGPASLQVADACTGLLVQLDRQPAP
jgi:sugar lactone lactonase YvrE